MSIESYTDCLLVMKYNLKDAFMEAKYLLEDLEGVHKSIDRLLKST